MYNTKINSVWILRIDPYRHIKVLQIHPSVLYGMYTFMENPRIDGKWILFKNENGAEIGKDKKRFFFFFRLSMLICFCDYPLRTLYSRKKSVISVLWENVEINFENLSANFFYLVVFRFFSMCNLLWKRSFVLYSCLLYLHSTTIKCISTSLTFCALMKINDGFCSKVFYSCTVIEHVTHLLIFRSYRCGFFCY